MGRQAHPDVVPGPDDAIYVVFDHVERLWTFVLQVYDEDSGLAVWSDPRFAAITAEAKRQHEGKG